MIYFLKDNATNLDEILGIDGFNCPGKLKPFFDLAKFIIIIIQIAVPFGLIIWGSLDWFKALIAHDEKEMRAKRKPFVSRVIAALIILLLPILLQLISKVIAGSSDTVNFFTCYNAASPKIDFSSLEEEDSDSNEIIGGFGDNGSGRKQNGDYSKKDADENIKDKEKSSRLREAAEAIGDDLFKRYKDFIENYEKGDNNQYSKQDADNTKEENTTKGEANCGVKPENGKCPEGCYYHKSSQNRCLTFEEYNIILKEQTQKEQTVSGANKR